MLKADHKKMRISYLFFKWGNVINVVYGRDYNANSEGGYCMEKVMVSKNDIFGDTTKLLHMMGTPAHIKGHDYLRTAIVYAFFDNSYFRRIVKGLYGDVAKEYSTTIGCVEQDIRIAIEIGWRRVDADIVEDVFSNTILYERSRPTNSEYIAMMVDRLKLKYYFGQNKKLI